MISWFAADSITGQSNGASISSWTDQAEGNNVTQGTQASQPTYVATDTDSKPALHFNGSQSLFNPNILGAGANADITMIAVGFTSSPSSQQYSAWLGGITTTGASRGMGYYTSQEIAITNAEDTLGAPAPSPSNPVIESWTLDPTRQNVAFYQNGTLSATGTLTGSQNITAGISVGYINGYTTVNWQGDIQEVLIYDHQLSSAEMAQINQYLGDKYNIYTPNATWYTKGVYAPYASEIQRNQWNIIQANAYIALQSNSSGVVTYGLIGWYAADQINGTGQSLPINGASVSSWTDLAQGNNVTSSSNQPTFVTSESNSKAGVHFYGNPGLVTTNSVGAGANADVTVISVGSNTAPTAQGYSLWMGGQSTGSSRGQGYYQSEELFDGSMAYAQGGPVPSSGTFVQEAATLNSLRNQVCFYQNGVPSTNSPVAVTAFTNVSPGISIGSYYLNGTKQWYWQGEIQEVLVYDHQLTATEMAQVSTYLAVKYNLPLPPTLPAPTISPASGSYTSPLTVTITPYSSSFAVHYTLDGTVPTINSPLYTGPISLTSSAYVSAIAYANSGADSSPAVGTQYYVNDSGQTGLPKPPTALTTTLISSSEIDLAWTLPTGAVTYQTVDVYRSVNGGAYELFAILPVTSTTFKDTIVSAGNSYSYSVGTFNEDGIASTSNSTGITPTAPTAISITVTTPSGAINLP